MLNELFFSDLKPCMGNNERRFTLAVRVQTGISPLSGCFPGVHLLSVFYVTLSWCVGMLSSSPTDDLFCMMVELMQRRAPITWGEACCDSCLSLRDSAQHPVLSWQPGSKKMSQLKHVCGRLRVISVQRSSLTRPDSETDVADNWKRTAIIIWEMGEKYAIIFVNSANAGLYCVKGTLGREAFVQWHAENKMFVFMCFCEILKAQLGE